MPRRWGRWSVLGALLVVAAFACASAHAAGDVRVNASFDRHARLGGSTALTVGLHVDQGLEAAPVTAVRLSYAHGLGVVSSSLGLATCTRPASDFEEVLITGSGLGGCPPNAVMAYGTARAEVRLNQSGQVIPEYATLTVLSGPLDHGHLQLVIFIDGQRPFGARLVISGEAIEAGGPYGGALLVRFPQVAGLQDVATITLTDLQLTIGAAAIRYYNHGHPYHPDGIAIPDRCPSHGFQFGLQLDFRDGRSRTAMTAAPCPTRSVRP